MARHTRGARPEATTAPPPEIDIEPAPSQSDANGSAPPEIPPADAKAKVSKYARFMASEQVLAASEETAHTCLYGPPPRTSFVRVHPDKSMRITLMTVVHEVGTKKQSYLLHEALQADPELEGMTKMVMVVPYITHHHPAKLGIWPISIENRNSWGQSAFNIVDLLEFKWLRVTPVVRRSEYVTKPCAVTFPEPDWSKHPPLIDGWLDLAFGPTDWLTPENWTDHPFRKFLREG
jgi:hypothetical protein